MKYTKFKDIPKFQHVSYQIDVTLERLPEWLEEMKKHNIQLNPDFQRGHVWTESQQTAYIEYLLRMPQKDKSTLIMFNFHGWRDTYEGDFVCVDGLQRLTAITKFINNEIPAYGTLYCNYEDGLRLVQTIQVGINNLPTKKEVLEWYIDMNSGGTVHTEEEINRVKELKNNL